MANNKVKFLRGTSSEYTAAEKDNDTIYFTTDDGKLYIGDKEILGESIKAFNSHINDSVKHITSTERTNWNAAKTHADSAHAPSNAQANVIETVKVNGTVLTPSSKAVNVTVPTKVSELTDSSDYVKTTDSRLTDARTPKAHNQASNTINAMTGYSKPSSTSAITTSDSLNTAIGKLEKALDASGKVLVQTGSCSTNNYGKASVTFSTRYKSVPVVAIYAEDYRCYINEVSISSSGFSCTNTIPSSSGNPSSYSARITWYAVGVV